MIWKTLRTRSKDAWLRGPDVKSANGRQRSPPDMTMDRCFASVRVGVKDGSARLAEPARVLKEEDQD